MTVTTISVLMVISIGVMSGTAIGLMIGYALRKHERDWSAMTRHEKTVTTGLIVVCSGICCAGLGWYFLVAPLA
jgi:NhaP-type Na+/H+ or K+/H+ antiporter